MNHKLIVVTQLKAQATKLETELAGVNAAILALGGTITGPGKGAGKAKAGRGGWPKGKPRGKRKTSVADPVSGLTPIQKAQAVRRANIAARKANANAATAGASLGEAASA